LLFIRGLFAGEGPILEDVREDTGGDGGSACWSSDPCHDLETAAGSLVVVEQLSSFLVRLVGDCETSGPSPHVPRAGSVPCLCDILFLTKFDGEYC
jgi:hypothetical protein